MRIKVRKCLDIEVSNEGLETPFLKIGDEIIMLLRLRTIDESLIVKDVVDIGNGPGFDMYVFQDEEKNWRVRINKKYVLDKKFDSKEKAEKRMCTICDWWNKWERTYVWWFEW